MTIVQTRMAERRDVPRIVEVHRRSFPSAFLTSLGSQFLSWYYVRAIESASGLCLVADRESDILGFACGSFEQEGRKVSIAPQVFPAIRAGINIVVARPKTIPALMKRSKWSREERHRLTRCDVRLESLATDPTYQKEGVGKILVKAYAASASVLGCRTISLTTAEFGNDGVIKFYESLGFEKTCHFQRDRPMLQFSARTIALV